LHIGLEKTATTSIQQFLYANEEQLLKENYKITKSLGKINNIGLTRILNKEKFLQAFMSFHGMEKKEDAIKALDKMEEEFRHEIKNAKWSKEKKDKTFIISSEHLQSRLDKNDIRNLKKLLINFGFTDFEIILVLRPQNEILLSRYSSGVKSGKNYEFLNDSNLFTIYSKNNKSAFVNFKKRKLLNYKESIANWCEIFGEKSLKVYDFKKLCIGSLEKNFLNIVDSNLDFSLFNEVKQYNQSLSIEMILALNKFNQKYKIARTKRKAFLDEIKKIKLPKKDYYFDNESINYLNHVFGDQNAEVEEKYDIDLKINQKSLKKEYFDTSYIMPKILKIYEIFK
tara:strand:+ start:1408 stop:2427 length:1020 start_codon:yes stop_codon:yes gene_type:complete